jgi:malonyl-CoA/methylmalonyl-CoA synthetase
MTLSHLFALSLRGRRDRPALEWAGGTVTFGEIERRSNRLARELLARGMGAGDRLAVYLPNRPEYIDLFIACMKVGIVCVPINVLYKEREAGHILRDAAPRALVLDGPPPSAEPVPLWSIDDLTHSAAQRIAETLPETVDADHPACIIYTSGTTGLAKGAVLTHNNLAANAANIITCWQITESDRQLLALPLFHVHGLGNGVHSWLATGCLLRLLPRFDHATAANEFLDFAPTLFFGVPTMYVRLLEMDEPTAQRVGTAARLFVSGSAPLAPAVFAEFERRFGHRILERYGMSETLMLLGNPYVGERRPGTVGHAFPGVSVRIVDRSGEDVADGETGELLVRSPALCAGYWNRPDATATAMQGGWFHTGDLGVRGDGGYITLQGRAHELIISGGFNIYPREVEEVLAEHEAVAEVAVVGVTDTLRGEIPVAFVVPHALSAMSGAELDAYCRERLASFKVPRQFVAVDALPRTALGKVQKGELLARWDRSGGS